MKRIREREREIQARMCHENRRFMGERKLRKQEWNRSPGAPEDKFTVTPKVASSCRWKLLAQLQRDRAWEQVYATARAQLLDGERPTFPAGTYQLRILHGVQVAQAPP